MPVSFDWEFEESDPSEQPGEGTSFSRRRRSWLYLGMTLLGLLVVGGLVVRSWLDNRLDAIREIEDELRSVVELELKDIANGDVELFRAVQDPTVPRWRSQQVARYFPNPIGAPNVYGFAPAPGLAPADRHPEIVQVRVVGRVGRVKLVHWFQPTFPLNPTDSLLARWLQAASSVTPVALPFHVTWFYRLSEDGAWYHTPPPEDHAGIPYTWHGAWLDVQASEIEDALLDPVIKDLFALAHENCQLLNCPFSAHYSLNFGDASAPQVYGNRWRLPALYLTGMPDNAVARAVWQQALKLWLVEALARSRAGSGVDNRVIYRQLVTQIQAELGLIEAPPLDVETLTQALLAGEHHFVQDLWEAEYIPNDPKGNQLLDVEVTVLLRWLQERIGAERTFALLPSLRRAQRLDIALLTVYSTAFPELEREWLVHLSALTGVLPTPQVAYRLPRSSPPGDQIALLCNDRVWVGNADGSDHAPLTAPGWPFSELYWSPDGRWLLTTWRYASPSQENALYLLAADGSSGRLLTDEPSLIIYPRGWVPGKQVFYYVYRDTTGAERGLGSVDIETGETRQLPGWPSWSPDGQRLVYRVQSPDGPSSALWLADANWENARQILDQVETQDRVWSPDSSQLALTLVDDDPAQNTIVLYDLATGSLTPLVTAAELTESLLSSGASDAFVSDGADLAELAHKPLQSLSPLGWSADGQRLVVRARASLEMPHPLPAVLVVVSLDGSPPRTLAYSNQDLYYGDTAWSPTHAEQLAFVWRTAPGRSGLASYLYDLEAGPIYTATGQWKAAWSPDGAWLAFAGQGSVTIVNQEGRVGFTLAHDDACPSVAWNPIADLSELSRFTSLSITLTASHDGWGFANVRADYDRLDQELHVWGELLNLTGSDQRVVALSPLLVYTVDEASVNFDQPDRQELAQSATLADGQSIPFNLNLSWPNDVQLEDVLTVVARVSAEPGQPKRGDLDILPEGLALSGQIGILRVDGMWENPGTDLDEYAMIVVTVYDEDGRVCGWGWQHETDPAYLASGAHDFSVAVTMSETITRIDRLRYYKVQLFAR
ncbi:MAG: hypothetical protein PVF45_02675 [Anaerolineae bacterium]